VLKSSFAGGVNGTYFHVTNPAGIEFQYNILSCIENVYECILAENKKSNKLLDRMK